VLRVFTRDGRGGNPLGVVDDLGGLDPRGMQAIAAGLGFSETVFVDTADPATPSVRIHTPVRELPFAGHPLVGAAWHLAREGRPPDALRCAAGDVAVRVDGEVVWIRPSMTFPVHPVEQPGLGGWAEPVEAAVASMPLRYRVVRLAEPADVAAVRPPAPVDHLLVWAWEVPDRVVRARFFASGSGVPEDPATGSAAIALAAVLGPDLPAFDIHQGEEVGSPSLLRVRHDAHGIEVGGSVVFDEVRTVS
jgi:predicted PhzF superfamily epimerase YddE/YHI9